MGLSQSLYTGWTGLTTHQRSMDNLGNNLANVNTVGYKKSDYMFSTIFNNYTRGAMPATDNGSTTNAVSVGLGASTGAILNNFTQGPVETTNNPLDLAINGNGFFMVSTASGTALTRNGSFYLDYTINPNERLLCAGEGLPVQGWMATNGVVTPSAAVGNIYISALGDVLAGNATTSVNLRGILPTNTSSSDFNGSQTTNLALKGDLPGGGQSMTAVIHAPVTETGGAVSRNNEMEAINVRIDFTGPTLSSDGTVNAYSWTMTTVDWPNVGDPGVQIYPAAGDPDFSRGTISFYAESSPAQERAAGQAVDGAIRPGSSSVATSVVNADGATVTASFTISSDFTLDVSRLTNLSNAPGGNGLEIWSVNGNPAGSMARTITVYSEYTDFIQTSDAAGNAIMEAVRSVEAREETLIFTRTGRDDSGNYWEWVSLSDGSSGSLKYDTQGNLAESAQSGGSIAYDFSETRNINSEGSMQVLDQDGFRDGYLQDITIDQNGKIWGHYSNDVVEALAQIAIATVPNASGLVGASGTLFYAGPASGGIMVGVAGDQDGALGLTPIGAGYLVSGALESSNVDLAREFTDMISIERGYQFNSKVITTSDEMLQTALNLKR